MLRTGLNEKPLNTDFQTRLFSATLQVIKNALSIFKKYLQIFIFSTGKKVTKTREDKSRINLSGKDNKDVCRTNTYTKFCYCSRCFSV